LTNGLRLIFFFGFCFFHFANIRPGCFRRVQYVSNLDPSVVVHPLCVDGISGVSGLYSPAGIEVQVFLSGLYSGLPEYSE
jgi:hypothetical protein